MELLNKSLELLSGTNSNDVTLAIYGSFVHIPHIRLIILESNTFWGHPRTKQLEFQNLFGLFLH